MTTGAVGFDRYLRSLIGSWRSLTRPHAGATVQQGNGWAAAFDPSDPVFSNGLLLQPYGLEPLIEFFGPARPYALWTRDESAAGLLRKAGWRLDETTVAMVADLADLATPAVSGGTDLVRVPGSVAATANGLRAGLLDGAPGLRAYASGDFGCVLALIQVDDDVNVSLVHTRPDLRRQGRAAALLAAALVQARGDGFRTASLQATPMGCGVYRRLGFRDVAVWQEWQPPLV